MEVENPESGIFKRKINICNIYILYTIHICICVYVICAYWYTYVYIYIYIIYIYICPDRSIWIPGDTICTYIIYYIHIVYSLHYITYTKNMSTLQICLCLLFLHMILYSIYIYICIIYRCSDIWHLALRTGGWNTCVCGPVCFPGGRLLCFSSQHLSSFLLLLKSSTTYRIQY